MSETISEMIKRLASQGGKVLVAGGQTKKDLDYKIKEHPQVIIWDDDVQDFIRKVVPANTRIILTNRLISHEKLRHLRDEANKLKIPVVMALRNIEIIGYISGLIPNEEAPKIKATEVKSEIKLEPIMAHQRMKPG